MTSSRPGFAVVAVLLLCVCGACNAAAPVSVQPTAELNATGPACRRHSDCKLIGDSTTYCAKAVNSTTALGQCLPCWRACLECPSPQDPRLASGCAQCGCNPGPRCTSDNNCPDGTFCASSPPASKCTSCYFCNNDDNALRGLCKNTNCHIQGRAALTGLGYPFDPNHETESRWVVRQLLAVRDTMMTTVRSDKLTTTDTLMKMLTTNGFLEAQLTPPQQRFLFSQIDADNNAQITLEEYTYAMYLQDRYRVFCTARDSRSLLMVLADSFNSTVSLDDTAVLPGCPCVGGISDPTRISSLAWEQRKSFLLSHCGTGYRCSRAAAQSLKYLVPEMAATSAMFGICVPCMLGEYCRAGTVERTSEEMQQCGTALQLEAEETVGATDLLQANSSSSMEGQAPSRLQRLCNSFSPCPAGKYCPTPSQVLDCSSGFFCSAGSIAPGSCNFHEVLENKSSPFYRPLMVMQDDPQFLLQKVFQSQAPLGGNFCPANSPTPLRACPAGHVCTNQSTSTPCPAGYFCPPYTQAPKKCVPLFFTCPEGSRRPNVAPGGFVLLICLMLLLPLFLGYIKWRSDRRNAHQQLEDTMLEFLTRMGFQTEKSSKNSSSSSSSGGALKPGDANASWLSAHMPVAYRVRVWVLANWERAVDLFWQAAYGCADCCVRLPWVVCRRWGRGPGLMSAGSLDSLGDTILGEKDLEEDPAAGFVKINPKLDLEFWELGLRLRSGKRLLQGVSGKFLHGQMHAVMGPSGSGKSTFIATLAGKSSFGETKGSVRLLMHRSSNSGTKAHTFQELRYLTGFVPQEDILHSTLTVRENLMFSAKLRLPTDSSQKHRHDIVRGVIILLGLAPVQHSVVGSLGQQGISGGQRKRVNIGMELVANPSLILLDEPTSGLDAAVSHDVLNSLRCMAESGMNIITVIHQPRYSIFQMFDNVLLLGVGGQTVYLGPTRLAVSYFQALGFKLPLQENPADFYLDVVSGAVGRAEDPHFTTDELFGTWSSGGMQWVEKELSRQRALTRQKSQIQDLVEQHANPEEAAEALLMNFDPQATLEEAVKKARAAMVRSSVEVRRHVIPEEEEGDDAHDTDHHRHRGRSKKSITFLSRQGGLLSPRGAAGAAAADGSSSNRSRRGGGGGGGAATLASLLSPRVRSAHDAGSTANTPQPSPRVRSMLMPRSTSGNLTSLLSPRSAAGTTPFTAGGRGHSRTHSAGTPVTSPRVGQSPRWGVRSWASSFVSTLRHSSPHLSTQPSAEALMHLPSQPSSEAGSQASHPPASTLPNGPPAQDPTPHTGHESQTDSTPTHPDAPTPTSPQPIHPTTGLPMLAPIPSCDPPSSPPNTIPPPPPGAPTSPLPPSALRAPSPLSPPTPPDAFTPPTTPSGSSFSSSPSPSPLGPKFASPFANMQDSGPPITTSDLAPLAPNSTLTIPTTSLHRPFSRSPSTHSLSLTLGRNLSRELPSFHLPATASIPILSPPPEDVRFKSSTTPATLSPANSTVLGSSPATTPPPVPRVSRQNSLQYTFDEEPAFPIPEEEPSETSLPLIAPQEPPTQPPPPTPVPLLNLSRISSSAALATPAMEITPASNPKHKIPRVPSLNLSRASPSLPLPMPPPIRTPRNTPPNASPMSNSSTPDMQTPPSPSPSPTTHPAILTHSITPPDTPPSHTPHSDTSLSPHPSTTSSTPHPTAFTPKPQPTPTPIPRVPSLNLTRAIAPDGPGSSSSPPPLPTVPSIKLVPSNPSPSPSPHAVSPYPPPTNEPPTDVVDIQPTPKAPQNGSEASLVEMAASTDPQAEPAPPMPTAVAPQVPSVTFDPANTTPNPFAPPTTAPPAAPLSDRPLSARSRGRSPFFSSRRSNPNLAAPQPSAEPDLHRVSNSSSVSGTATPLNTSFSGAPLSARKHHRRSSSHGGPNPQAPNETFDWLKAIVAQSMRQYAAKTNQSHLETQDVPWRPKDLQAIKDMFRRLDSNQDGILAFDEFIQFWSGLKRVLDPQEWFAFVERMIAEFGISRDGTIAEEQFMTVIKDKLMAAAKRGSGGPADVEWGGGRDFVTKPSGRRLLQQLSVGRGGLKRGISKFGKSLAAAASDWERSVTRSLGALHPLQAIKGGFEMAVDGLKDGWLGLFGRQVGGRNLPSTFRQMRVVIHRSYVKWFNDKGTLVMDVLLLAVVALLIGVVQRHPERISRVPPNAAMALVAFGVMSTVTSLRTFGSDLTMFLQRESQSGLSTLAYFSGKLVWDTVDLALRPAIFLSCYFLMTQFDTPFSWYYLILVMVSWYTYGFGYFASVVFDRQVALVFATAVPLIFGAIINGAAQPTVCQARQGDSGWFVFLGISYSRWAIEGITIKTVTAAYSSPDTVILGAGALAKVGYCNMDQFLNLPNCGGDSSLISSEIFNATDFARSIGIATTDLQMFNSTPLTSSPAPGPAPPSLLRNVTLMDSLRQQGLNTSVGRLLQLYADPSLVASRCQFFFARDLWALFVFGLVLRLLTLVILKVKVLMMVKGGAGSRRRRRRRGGYKEGVMVASVEGGVTGGSERPGW